MKIIKEGKKIEIRFKCAICSCEFLCEPKECDTLLEVGIGTDAIRYGFYCPNCCYLCKSDKLSKIIENI